jgi:hypothetical protein
MKKVKMNNEYMNNEYMYIVICGNIVVSSNKTIENALVSATEAAISSYESNLTFDGKLFSGDNTYDIDKLKVYSESFLSNMIILTNLKVLLEKKNYEEMKVVVDYNNIECNDSVRVGALKLYTSKIMVQIYKTKVK